MLATEISMRRINAFFFPCFIIMPRTTEMIVATNIPDGRIRFRNGTFATSPEGGRNIATDQPTKSIMAIALIAAANFFLCTFCVRYRSIPNAASVAKQKVDKEKIRDGAISERNGRLRFARKNTVVGKENPSDKITKALTEKNLLSAVCCLM